MSTSVPEMTVTENSDDSRCGHIVLQYEQGERGYSLHGMTVVAVCFFCISSIRVDK